MHTYTYMGGELPRGNKPPTNKRSLDAEAAIAAEVVDASKDEATRGDAIPTAHESCSTLAGEAAASAASFTDCTHFRLSRALMRTRSTTSCERTAYSCLAA